MSLRRSPSQIDEKSLVRTSYEKPIRNSIGVFAVNVSFKDENNAKDTSNLFLSYFIISPPFRQRSPVSPPCIRKGFVLTLER